MDVHRGMNLLIVDDSQADARLLQLWLNESSMIRSILIAPNGANALSLAGSKNASSSDDSIDMILLDGNLPDMSGLEVLAELKRRPECAKIGVLMLSGTFNPRDAEQAATLGADDYRAKPFEGDDFARLVVRIEEFWSARG